MRRFKKYHKTEFEEIIEEEHIIIFGDENNSFQEGFGHGVIYGSKYNNTHGGGHGGGYEDGVGGNVYPHPLIQYWKDKI